MATKKSSSPDTCGLTDNEYNTLTMDLAHIDALANMGFPEGGEATTQTAFLLIQERAEKMGELLSAANERWQRSGAN